MRNLLTKERVPSPSPGCAQRKSAARLAMGLRRLTRPTKTEPSSSVRSISETARWVRSFVRVKRNGPTR